MMTVPSGGAGVGSRELLNGFVTGEIPGFQVSDLTADSRSMQPGGLFIALPGLNHHALDFAPDAVAAGAVGVLFDPDDKQARQRLPLLKKQLDTRWLAVEDLQRRTGEIAARFYGYPSHCVHLIGITGTDGKTSVTHLLAQSLRRLQRHVGSIGTLGYGADEGLRMTPYTTPDAISLQGILAELVDAGCDTVVMEVSSHALEQQRVSGCEFDIAVLTNLGSDHLDYHGTHEEYAAAKSMLFEWSGLTARVINLDDALGRELARRHAGQAVFTFAREAAAADVRLLDSGMGPTGLHMRVACEGIELTVQTALIGAFNIENCLACIAVLRQSGFTPREIEQAMQGLQPISGRMEFLPAVDGMPAVVIDFAHTEQALEACLSALQGFVPGRLICVFGCGGDRDKGKRPLMAAVAERLADRVIVTDDNPRTESAAQIAADILAGFRDPQHVSVIHDRQRAIASALRDADSIDLVVIAGKGHEQVQIVGDRKIPFQDRAVVEALRREAGA